LLAASVSGTVELAPALKARTSPDDTVFVFARAIEGSRMPLAILRKQVRDLPLRFTLDDDMAMSPDAKLSGASRVVVGARISKSGDAMPRAGDLQGQLDAVAVGARQLKVEINQEVTR
jgi:cytochrome c-type biogenesis protein CcmH